MKTMLFRTGLLACVLTAALPLAAQTGIGSSTALFGESGG